MPGETTEPRLKNPKPEGPERSHGETATAEDMLAEFRLLRQQGEAKGAAEDEDLAKALEAAIREESPPALPLTGKTEGGDLGAPQRIQGDLNTILRQPPVDDQDMPAQEKPGLATTSVREPSPEERSLFRDEFGEKAIVELGRMGFDITAQTDPDNLMKRLQPRGWQDDAPTRAYIRAGIDYARIHEPPAPAAEEPAGAEMSYAEWVSQLPRVTSSRKEQAPILTEAEPEAAKTQTPPAPMEIPTVTPSEVQPPAPGPTTELPTETVTPTPTPEPEETVEKPVPGPQLSLLRMFGTEANQLPQNKETLRELSLRLERDPGALQIEDVRDEKGWVRLVHLRGLSDTDVSLEHRMKRYKNLLATTVTSTDGQVASDLDVRLLAHGLDREGHSRTTFALRRSDGQAIPDWFEPEAGAVPPTRDVVETSVSGETPRGRLERPVWRRRLTERVASALWKGFRTWVDNLDPRGKDRAWFTGAAVGFAGGAVLNTLPGGGFVRAGLTFAASQAALGATHVRYTRRIQRETTRLVGEERATRVAELSATHQNESMKIRNFFRGVAAGGTVASIGALGVHGLVAVAQEFSVTPPYIAPPDIRAWIDGVLNRFPHPSLSPEVGPPQSDVFTLDQPTTMQPPELTEGGVVQAPVETPAAPFAGEGVAPEQVTPPVSGETAAQQVQGGEVPAQTAPVENASTLLEKLHETVPADVIDVDIRPGTTVSEIIVANTDQAITWGPQDARVFGAHIGANYDLLRDMWEKMVAAGHETGSFMSFGEIEDLVEKAEQGDSAARLRLIKALHWIPAGQKFHILTKAGVRATMAALTVA